MKPRRLIVWWTEGYRAPVTLDEADLAHLHEQGIDVKTYLYEIWADWSGGPDVKSTSFEIYSIAADEGEPLPGLAGGSGSGQPDGPTAVNDERPRDGGAPVVDHDDEPPTTQFPSLAEVQGIVRTLADVHRELGADFEFLSARQKELMALCDQHVAVIDHDLKETV